MALSTYAELLTAVAAYDDVASSVESSNLPDLVTLAEKRMFYGSGDMPALRCRAMEKVLILPVKAALDGGTSTGSADAQIITIGTAPTLEVGLNITFTAGYTNTGAMTIDADSTGVKDVRSGKNRDALAAGDVVAGGVYTVYYDGTYYVLVPSAGCIPLPSRWLGHKAAYIQDRQEPLTYMPASGINWFMYGATAGVPEYFAVEGDCLRLDPVPADDTYISVTYYKEPAALSSALNDIFRDAPQVYLFATLLELAIFLPAEERISAFTSEYLKALSGYSSSDAKSLFGYAPMRVRLRIAP